MIKFLKTLYHVVKDYDNEAIAVAEIQELHRKQLVSLEVQNKNLMRLIHEATSLIRDRTEVHLDIAANRERGQNTVILVGRYKNRDYVQCYQVNEHHFRDFLEHLQDVQRYGEIRYVDAPPAFKAIINKEL